MSDFEDRLVALDPAAGRPYQHQDLDALISRITSQRVTPRRQVWRGFQLKMAGAFAASALLTLGAITALQGVGTNLPLLAIQGTRTGATPKSDAVPGAFRAAAIYAEFHFTAGPGLTPTTPTNPSYQLQIPSDGSAEASRVASIFGVSSTPVNANGDGSDWTLTDASGSSLDYQNSGVPQWYYALTSPSEAPATASNTSTTALPSQSTLEGDVRSFLAKLGYGYTVSSPNFGSSTATTTNANGTAQISTSEESVTYTVVVGGIDTDQSVTFSIDANNNVVFASGPAFSVGPSYNYPLQSLAAGVVALNTEQQSRFPSNSSTPSSGSSANSGASTTTSTTPSGPPIVNVTLISDSLTLATYQMTDGTTWLLPVYNYAGQAPNADATSSNSNWYELAVDPSYVQVSSNSSGVGTGEPINY